MSGGASPRGRVLVVAGSDSGAGAGIQADIKTVMALGGYALTAVTAVTVQNTLGVSAVHEIPPALIADQMSSVLADIGADAIKTGMIASAGAVRAIAAIIKAQSPRPPLVLDPVMRAKGGHVLADPSTVKALKDELFPLASLLTPNIPEAEHLAGFAIRDLDDTKRAAQMLMSLGPEAVLIKGAHRSGETIQDVLLTAQGFTVMTGSRIDTPHTHGTGCTLASAIAVSLAQGLAMADAVERARAYVREAIRTAPGLGKGHGPLNHAHVLRSPGNT